MPELTLYNTTTRSLEPFIPKDDTKHVTLYHCGPTVYNYAHIGNMRAYVFADTLRRTLEWNGFPTKQVINITDVGHLVSDADEGEDKMEVGAKREGLDVESIIQKYTEAFLSDSDALHILRAHEYPRATQHIQEQIALITTLEQRGHTYTTNDGVYFDTTTFSRYPDFAHIDLEGLSAGERVDLGEKKHPTDFALWKLNTTGEKRLQEWDSPWGVGFPGWHIECSAMSMKCLNTETIDIHTGGVDHIPVHHTNEIAQSECATGRQFARYWMHVAFMNVDNQKMSKSLGNTYRVSELKEKFGISPLGYRYWLLTSHYRTQANFTVEAVRAAETALTRLQAKICALKIKHESDGAKIHQVSIDKARTYINNDLNTAKVIALLHDILSPISTVPENERYLTIKEIDKLTGLGLDSITDNGPSVFIVPAEYEELRQIRERARAIKDWKTADEARDALQKQGFDVVDNPDGTCVLKQKNG